jgi:tetratricopeptide (TPR) repeat protein
MTLTVILIACALRLAQLSLVEQKQLACNRVLARPAWIQLSAAGSLLSLWSVCSLFGPAMASIHWDRYLHNSVDHSRTISVNLGATPARLAPGDSAMAERLSDAMIRHLERAAYWDPYAGRVQLKLAAKCIARFELLQQRGENAMLLSQIRDAALSSRFASAEDLRRWLGKAVGENIKLLYRAYDHAIQAASLCPLQGEAYMFLAKLSFLDGSPAAAADEYTRQALRVRPYDADVLYEVGNSMLITGDLESAIKYWARCFGDRGDHQLRIIHALAGRRIPASIFLQPFNPDWRTLREIWARYRQFGQMQDLQDLAAYAATVTRRQVQEKNGIPASCIWLWQASMYTDIQLHDDALNCLEQAYRAGPSYYEARYALAKALMNAGRFAEAEPHVRWCLARRPENKSLKGLLLEISKQRVARRQKASLSTE